MIYEIKLYFKGNHKRETIDPFLGLLVDGDTVIIDNGFSKYTYKIDEIGNIKISPLKETP